MRIEIQGRGGGDVLQSRLAQTDVARASQAGAADRLCVCALDSGASGVLDFEVLGLLVPSCSP